MDICMRCKNFKENGCFKNQGTIYYNDMTKIRMGNCLIDGSLKNELNGCHNESFEKVVDK